MLNFYIKSFNVCLTAAGNREKKPTPFAVLAIRRDKIPDKTWQLH